MNLSQTIGRTGACRLARSIKGRATDDNLTLEKVGLWPSTITVGSEVTLDVEMTATADNALGTFVGDPDFCTPNAFLNDGIQVQLELRSLGQSIERTTRCVADGQSNSQRWQPSFVASRAGTVDLFIEARGAQSGNFLGEIVHTVEITNTDGSGGDNGGGVEPAPCQVDADCSGDLVCSGGQCVMPSGGGSSDPFDQIQALLALSIVAIVLLQATD